MPEPFTAFATAAGSFRQISVGLALFNVRMKPLLGSNHEEVIRWNIHREDEGN